MALFVKVGVLKNFAFSTGKHLERLQHSCFPVNITKFLVTAFFIEDVWWVLPTVISLQA